MTNVLTLDFTILTLEFESKELKLEHITGIAVTFLDAKSNQMICMFSKCTCTFIKNRFQFKLATMYGNSISNSIYWKHKLLYKRYHKRGENKVNEDFVEKPFGIPMENHVHSMKNGYFSQNQNSIKYITTSIGSSLWWFSNYETLFCACEDWELSVKWFRCRSKWMKKIWLCSACSSHLHMYSMLYQLADLRVMCASTSRYSTHTQTYEHICSRINTDFRKISETSCHLLENTYF